MITNKHIKKQAEEKNKRLEEMLAEIEGVQEITTLRHLSVFQQVAKVADDFSQLTKHFDKQDIAYYKELANVCAEYVVEFYWLEKKPKLFLRELKELPRDKKKLVFDWFLHSFDIRSRNGDFDSFLKAREWNKPADKQIYEPRRKVLIRHKVIEKIQNLHNGKTKMLIIEAPPSIGKTLIGTGFCEMRSGISPTSKGLIGTANASLAQGFYNDLINFMTGAEYRHRTIFNDNRQIIPNAENNSIYFNAKTREPNILCRSIEVGATGITHLNKQGYLYMDDTIKTSEQANNKDYLMKMIYMFTSTFFDRRDNNDVPVLIVGTPWSLHDLIAYLKMKFGHNDWFDVISIPAFYVDEKGERKTNFDYEGEAYKSLEYWDEQMAVEDPVIANAKYLMRPMEREGRPFAELEYFRMAELNERLKVEKPFVYNATDVAVKAGGDYLFSGFHYLFESTKEIYLVDVVYNNKGTDFTIPQMIKKYIEHNVERGEFEEKEGTVTSKVNYGIGNVVKEETEKLGHRCFIGVHSGAGLKSKGTRIDTYAPEIRGQKSISGYIIKFLHINDRKTHAEYNLLVQHVQAYSQSAAMQGKQIDDGTDGLSMGLAYCVDRPQINTVQVASAKKYLPY